MRKIFLLFVAVLIASFCFPLSAHAADDTFGISSTSTFSIQDSGKTRVTQRIEIVNKTEFYYTPSYGMSIGYGDVDNIAVFNSSGNSIPFTVSDIDQGKKIEVIFPDKIVGIDKRNIFSISFDTEQIAKKNGSIWEISVPGIKNIEDFENYTISLSVPQSFGKPTIIKPKKNYQINGSTISFDKKAIGDSGIYIMFGTEQYYNFNLDYHISNTNLFPVKTEIALPPSTNYQDVLINSIEPRPLDVYQDEDGNWLAEFSLNSQQRQTVHVKGLVRVSYLPKSQVLTAEQRTKYTQSKKNWETGSREIKDTAANLKDARDIYEYVVKTLSYDYEKVSGDNKRLGAKEALLHPDNAVCLEFTDLFVALARAKGIPARSVEGYAYTGDDKLRPVSLVKDVLHAWPEYYDDKKQAWIMIDPTWGNTTGGTDYFDVFDFDHVAFVLKGIDSEYPIPAGGYKFTEDSKDVSMTFAKQADFKPKSFISIDATIPEFALSAFPIHGNVLVQNTGNSPLYKKSLKINSPLTSRQNEFLIDALPPYGKSVVLLDFEKTPFLTNKSYPVTIQFDEYKKTHHVQVSIFPQEKIIFIAGGISASIIILLIAAGQARRLYLQRRLG